MFTLFLIEQSLLQDLWQQLESLGTDPELVDPLVPAELELSSGFV